MSTFVYSMASVAIMAGGTVLNALTKDNSQRLPAKKKKDMTKLSRLTKPLIDWVETQHENKELAKQNFTNTD